MALINFTSVQDGTTAVASQVNAPLTTIYNEFNGNITAVNLAANSVTTAKLADASVTNMKVDFGGAGAGIWWEEIGRTTLTVAGDTITVDSLPTRKYLQILIYAAAIGGTINQTIRFNNDSGANYSRSVGTNGGVFSSSVSQTGHIATDAVSEVQTGQVDVLNIATQEKQGFYLFIQRGASGAGTAGTTREGFHKWVNTTNAISRVDITNAGTGDYAIGSEVIVLGHN